RVRISARVFGAPAPDASREDPVPVLRPSATLVPEVAEPLRGVARGAVPAAARTPPAHRDRAQPGLTPPKMVSGTNFPENGKMGVRHEFFSPSAGTQNRGRPRSASAAEPCAPPTAMRRAATCP